MAQAMPKVWSLWVYDRHCNLIYHRDWSNAHNQQQKVPPSGATLPHVSRAPLQPPPRGGAASAPSSGGQPLPLEEQAKLVYGVVFSLRNMCKKLGGRNESFNGYSTSSYTLSHLQTPTMHTFVLLTDAVAPSSRSSLDAASFISSSSSSTHATSAAAQATAGTAASASTSSSSFMPAALLASAGFARGGASSNAGGATSTGSSAATTAGWGAGRQSLVGVLEQIWRGPWCDFVARNPACDALERQTLDDLGDDDNEEEDDDDDDDDSGNDAGVDMGRLKLASDAEKEPANKRIATNGDKTQARPASISAPRPRLSGIDSDGFRDAIERVLAANRLWAPPLFG